MTKLFTFGGGSLGELGTGRSDDARRPDAVAVTFPEAADGQAIQDFALGVDHSVAVVDGHVYWWGLWGAHSSGSTGSSSIKPEVVPLPTSIHSLPVRGREEHDGHPDETGVLPDGRARSVACGGSNSFILTDDGEAFVLGSLRPPGGNPNAVRHLWGSPCRGPGTRVACIAAGWRHCLLLTEAGQVYALGDDEHGQCAAVSSGTTAVAVPTTEAVVGIAAGACHSIAWDSAGAAFAWGHSGSGRLGLGRTQHRRAPSRVAKLAEPVCMVSCGANFTMFVASSGQTVWACGGNQHGQLGLGAQDQTAHEVPEKIGFPRGGEEVISIAAGANHVLCVTRLPTSAGRSPQRAVVWAWGCASSGQLGRAEGERPGRASTQARGVPEALADFLIPSPAWALKAAAGRSHSAVLAAPDTIAGGLLSPRLVKTPSPAKRRATTEADDIIDMFCAGLGNCSSRQNSPTWPRSPSMSPRTSTPYDPSSMDAGHSTRASPRKSQGRVVATTARRSIGGRQWARASPTWSSVGQRQGSSFNGHSSSFNAYRSVSPHFRTASNSQNMSLRSPVKDQAIPTGTSHAPLVLGSEDDKWTDMHESLDGLGSMIASIGGSHTPPAVQSAAGGGSRRPLYGREKLVVTQPGAAARLPMNSSAQRPMNGRPHHVSPRLAAPKKSRSAPRREDDAGSDVSLDFEHDADSDCGQPYHHRLPRSARQHPGTSDINEQMAEVVQQGYPAAPPEIYPTSPSDRASGCFATSDASPTRRSFTGNQASEALSEGMAPFISRERAGPVLPTEVHGASWQQNEGVLAQNVARSPSANSDSSTSESEAEAPIEEERIEGDDQQAMEQDIEGGGVEIAQQGGRSIEESYVELEISRNDPSFGLPSMSSQPLSGTGHLELPDDMEPSLDGGTSMEDSESQSAASQSQSQSQSQHDDISKRASERSMTDHDVDRLVQQLNAESSSDASDDSVERDEALLAGLGFAEDNDEDEGDWV